MLARNVQVEGFSAAHWQRLFELTHAHPARENRVPPTTAAASSAQPEAHTRSGGLIVVSADQRVRKLLHTERGRLPLAAQRWPVPLAELVHEHAARWGVRIACGALDELMDRFAERMQRDQDYLEQWLQFLSAARELETEGSLEFWPWRLQDWPELRAASVYRALDSVWPAGKCAVLGVFEHGDLYTCVALRRQSRGIDYIVGPDVLREEMGLLSGDFRRDYRHLAHAVQLRLGELALGCYAERQMFRQLSAEQAPGAWAAAVAARDVIVSPLVPAVAVPLGLDAGRAAFGLLRDVAARYGLGDWLPSGARERGRDLVPSGWETPPDLRRLLGFDPLSVWRQLRQLRG